MNPFAEPEIPAVCRAIHEQHDTRGLPAGARALAVPRLGHVDVVPAEPLFETLNWDRRRPRADLVFTDSWNQTVQTP